MIAFLLIGISGILGSMMIWKAAMSTPTAAGAGALGSVMMLTAGLCVVVSIFCFGMSLGIALAPHIGNGGF